MTTTSTTTTPTPIIPCTLVEQTELRKNPSKKRKHQKEKLVTSLFFVVGKVTFFSFLFFMSQVIDYLLFIRTHEEGGERRSFIWKEEKSEIDFP